MLPSVWLPGNFSSLVQESKISLTDTAAKSECVRSTFGGHRAGRSQGYYHKGIWKTFRAGFSLSSLLQLATRLPILIEVGSLWNSRK